MNLGDWLKDVHIPEALQHPGETWDGIKESFHGDNNSDPIAKIGGSISPGANITQDLFRESGLTHGLSAEDNANLMLDRGFQSLADHNGVHRDTENGGADDWIGNKSATTIAALITAGAFAGGAFGGESGAEGGAAAAEPGAAGAGEGGATEAAPWEQYMDYAKYAGAGSKASDQQQQEEEQPPPRAPEPAWAQQSSNLSAGNDRSARTNLAATLPVKIDPSQVDWET